MEEVSPISATTTVFSIAKLREAILIQFALLHQQDWHCNTLHHRGPILELFPLQRVSRALATTIRQSPEIRRFSYGSDNTSPVYWILSNIKRYRTRTGWRRPREPHNGRSSGYTDYRGELCFKWEMPGHWTGEEASWRNIKAFLENRDRQGFELTHPFMRAVEPMLGTVYGFCGEMLRKYEPEILGAQAAQVGTRTAEVDAATFGEGEPLSSDSAMSTVFGIAELREAILVEYALIRQEEGLCDLQEHPAPGSVRPRLVPVVELFPIQRVCHAFAVTIRKSPQLRSFMCLAGDFASPLDWFLSTLNMYRQRYQGTKEAEMREEYFVVYTNIKDESEPRWQLPAAWKHADASWRRMKIFAEDRSTSDLRLSIVADPFDDEFMYGPLDPEKVAVLQRRDDPTLETFHELIEEVVREVEPRLRRMQLQRDREAARYEAESTRLRIAYYGEEINAMHPRGSTPPPVREDYRKRHLAQRREAGREFSAWRKAQRQREYEAELLEHRGVCGYCAGFDLDEG